MGGCGGRFVHDRRLVRAPFVRFLGAVLQSSGESLGGWITLRGIA